ncbi:unnamed protein product [Adineta steineri]|uniref:Uncharacterized protein n=1 Tax=Adineta steineri TaxID=433720 RepID=A0A818I450_9BILA|nr:unnamed protein product [Adineta steineri]CAF3518723.1 unnamed protein product [Adineta steineri]
MQKYQQRLLVFALFLTTTYAATKIQSFGALSDVKVAGDLSSVYPTHIEVGAKVTGCLESKCECSVKTTGIDDDPIPLTFTAESNDLGSAQISNLRPQTPYLITLTCSFTPTETDTKPVPVTIITDYDRPLAPKIVKVSLALNKITINWQPGSTSGVTYDFYKIIVDNKMIEDNIDSHKTSFEMPDVYNYGVEHTIYVQACKKNNQKHATCSRLEGNGEKFKQAAPTDAPATTTTATTTTAGPIPTEVTSSATTASTPTSTKSIGVHSYTISIPIIIFSLFFFLLK